MFLNGHKKGHQPKQVSVFQRIKILHKVDHQLFHQSKPFLNCLKYQGLAQKLVEVSQKVFMKNLLSSKVCLRVYLIFLYYKNLDYQIEPLHL